MTEPSAEAPKAQAVGKQEKPEGAANASAPRSQSEFKKEKGRGLVKSVLSGDTLVILVHDKNHRGPPAERIVTLSNIQAPKLGRKKSETTDEPFAWASREFLRKKAIGKPVSFSIEYRPLSNSGYGAVYLISETQQENLAKLIVSAGWAKAKRPNVQKEPRPELDELIQAEEQAAKDGKGVFGGEDAGRNVVSDFEETELFTKLKGASHTGIIEKVFSGSSFKILLPLGNVYYDITLHLSGVRSPDKKEDGTIPPFTREAVFFSEHYLLNRDVSIIFEGVDKRVFYGSISYAGHNIAEELVLNGLAEYVDWSARRTSFQDKLRTAEATAKEKRLRMWGGYVEPKALTSKEERKQIKPGKEILGKVVEVVHAGCVVVQDQNNTRHKLQLSSIRVPRQGSLAPQDRETKEEAYEKSLGFEAKQYLRKRVIGQRVRAVIDYLRKGREAAANEPEKPYASIYVDKNNVAVELAEQGYARAAEHRAGEPRSRDYEHILLAEQRAAKLQRGWHTPIEKANLVHLNDLTLDSSKSRQILPFLKKSGKLRGVVEFEFSASKLKVYVPKENVMIPVSLAGIRTPGRQDAFSKEALDFTRELVHQQDADVEIIGVDKGGNFTSVVFVNRQNLAVQLLEAGFASVMRSAAADTEYANEFTYAEEVAKKARKNIWQNYDQKAEEERQRKQVEEDSERRKPKQEIVHVMVTEIIDGGSFYAQIINQEAAQLEELMKNLSVQDNSEPHKPAVGELVKAQFTADDAWYRAAVTGTTPEGEFSVHYIDYGNVESLPASRIRKLDPAFQKLPAQAQLAKLAYVRVPAIYEEFGREAAIFLRDLVWGKPMVANVEYRDGGALYLSVGDRESQVHVNAALLRAGLARVERIRSRNLQPLLEKLREEENKARAAHVCLWQYGDPGSDDEDDLPRLPAKKAPAAADKAKEEKKPAKGKGGKEEASE